MTESFQTYPGLLPVLLIVAGYVVAVFLSKAVASALRWLGKRIKQSVPSMTLLSARGEALVQRLVFYVTLGVFVMLALRSLGHGELSEILDPIIEFLPGIFSGAIIAIVGYITSEIVYRALRNSPWTNGNPILARAAQAIILTVSLLTGLAQASINVRLIEQTLIVVLFVTLGSMSLAFALGSRDYVANVLARRLFDGFAIGDRIRMGEVEGTIVDFKQFSVLVQTQEGVAVIPARTFANAIVVRLTSS